MKNNLPKTKLQGDILVQTQNELKDALKTAQQRLESLKTSQRLDSKANWPKYAKAICAEKDVIAQIEDKLKELKPDIDKQIADKEQAWKENYNKALAEEEAYKAFKAKCLDKIQWKCYLTKEEQELRTKLLKEMPKSKLPKMLRYPAELRTGKHVQIHNEVEFINCYPDRNNIHIIQMLYFNWSKDTTYFLAQMYANGTRVVLGNKTEIKSKRYPRPFIPNCTPEENAVVHKIQTEQNNKTCNEFIKAVAYTLTKGYKTNPLIVDIEYGWAIDEIKKGTTKTDVRGVRIKTPDKRITTYIDKPEYTVKIKKGFPQTKDIAHFAEGVQDAMVEMRTTKTFTEKEKIAFEHKRQLYCEGVDCNTHYATQHAHYYTEETVYNKFKKTYETKNVSEKVSTVLYDEVYTWKEGFRTSSKHNGDKYRAKNLYPYQSDIKTTYEDSAKMAEMEDAIKWLEENDMLDLHTYHCPNCGNLANSYEGCTHCGYELPKEAVADFNNGRLTREELNTMSVDDIEDYFTNNETAVSYDEWRSGETEDTDDTDEENFNYMETVDEEKLDCFTLSTDYE